MPVPLTFEEYLAELGRLTAHIDPTASTPAAIALKAAAESLAEFEHLDVQVLAGWVTAHPRWTEALTLAVGLSQEKTKNVLRHHFNTTGLLSLANTRALELVTLLDEEFDLMRVLEVQRYRTYSFGDILVARAGPRVTATSAGVAGRKVEDEIEGIAIDLGLPYETRTSFIGRNDRRASCDLVIPNGAGASIAVAAKGFDSTGSKLRDAVREIEEMADVRQPRQFILAVVDGIGWKNRQADLRRIYELWSTQQIDGMYTLASLERFRADLEEMSRLRGLHDG